MNALTYADFQSLSLGTIAGFVTRLNQYRESLRKAQEDEMAKAKSKGRKR